jgi:hypothetical protein
MESMKLGWNGVHEFRLEWSVKAILSFPGGNNDPPGRERGGSIVRSALQVLDLHRLTPFRLQALTLLLQ